MNIRRLKSFESDYRKLKPGQQARLKRAISLFVVDHLHPDLYNHPLKGEWVGHCSIAFGGDWRAHYKIVDGVAVFVACGTHAQLYK